MAPKKSVLVKRKRTRSSLRAPSPTPDNLEKFITRDAESLYHNSLYNKTFVLERGFPNSNAYFSFVIQEKGWTKLCEHPLVGIALIVCEFYSNPRFRVGSTVYVRGKWVDFSTIAINRLYNMVDDDSEAYEALFHNTDYHQCDALKLRGPLTTRQPSKD